MCSYYITIDIFTENFYKIEFIDMNDEYIAYIGVFILLIILAIIMVIFPEIPLATLSMIGYYPRGENKFIKGAHDKPRGNLRIKNLKINPRTKSEANVIRMLEDLTGASFPTVNPNWLRWKGRTLELDGYNEKLKIALEFSGPLHTKWFPEREPYEKYFDRVVKDIVKLRVCKKNNVNLIVVDMILPSKHWRDYLESRLYDIGFLSERPTSYIPEQTAEPFRNKQIERELGLTQEIQTARKL